MREALQRLASAGYVDVRQGGSTTVRDFRRLGGLDLLPRLLLARGGLDLAVARSILEARAHVGPKIAELAAPRADPRSAPHLREPSRSSTPTTTAYDVSTWRSPSGSTWSRRPTRSPSG